MEDNTHMDHAEPSPTTLAHHIATIWWDVLGTTDTDPNATFFQLQGQSISAVRIAASIEDELGITIDVATLFEDPDLTTFTHTILTTTPPTT